MATNDQSHNSLQVRDRNGTYRNASPDEIINAAQSAINRRFRRGKILSSPVESREFLKLRLAHLEHEVFSILWLDNQHRILAFDEMFRGTIDSSSIHPREIVKTALRINAASCILSHNHPSGMSSPSESDRAITKKINEVLSLIEVRVLDHIIVGEDCLSFAEQGLL